MLATLYLLKLMLIKHLISDLYVHIYDHNHLHFHVQVFKAPRKIQMIKSVKNKRKVTFSL